MRLVWFPRGIRRKSSLRWRFSPRRRPEWRTGKTFERVRVRNRKANSILFYCGWNDQVWKWTSALNRKTNERVARWEIGSCVSPIVKQSIEREKKRERDQDETKRRKDEKNERKRRRINNKSDRSIDRCRSSCSREWLLSFFFLFAKSFVVADLPPAPRTFLSRFSFPSHIREKGQRRASEYLSIENRIRVMHSVRYRFSSSWLNSVVNR